MNCGVQRYLLLLPRGLLLTSVICLEWRELVWRRQCVLARAATQTLTPGPGSRSITKLYFNESWGCWEPETILLFRRQANTRPSIDLFSNQLFYLSLFVQSKQILFEGRKPIKASFSTKRNNQWLVIQVGRFYHTQLLPRNGFGMRWLD